MKENMFILSSHFPRGSPTIRNSFDEIDCNNLSSGCSGHTPRKRFSNLKKIIYETANIIYMMATTSTYTYNSILPCSPWDWINGLLCEVIFIPHSNKAFQYFFIPARYRHRYSGPIPHHLGPAEVMPLSR